MTNPAASQQPSSKQALACSSIHPQATQRARQGGTVDLNGGQIRITAEIEILRGEVLDMQEEPLSDRNR